MRALLPSAAEVASLRYARPDELRAHVVAGHTIDELELAGWTYRGTVLGAAALVERLTWSSFQKAFHRDAITGSLMGWNVRLHQDGVTAPSRPRERAGVPHCTWFYEVIEPRGVAVPHGLDRGLIIDYGRSPHNPSWEPMRAIKDPLVALRPGDPTCLLGMSYLVVGGICVETPTYFSLQREHRTTHVPACVARANHEKSGAARAEIATATVALARTLAARFGELSRQERALADAIFAAIYTTKAADLPDRRDVAPAIWEIFAHATAPTFGPGLRAMLHALNAMPLGYAGYRQRFQHLSRAQQVAFIERLAADARYLTRQLVATFKLLGGLAYFDDAAVRARYGA